jgi:TIR domain
MVATNIPKEVLAFVGQPAFPTFTPDCAHCRKTLCSRGCHYGYIEGKGNYTELANPVRLPQRTYHGQSAIMTDIFLSYASEDLDQAKSLVRALEAEGFSIFWDRAVPGGASWRDVIGEKLEAAAVVIVLWSVRSVESVWVSDEADFARNQAKLIPVLLDEVEPPLGFRAIQAADLTKWDGARSHPSFIRLIEAIHQLTGPSAVRSVSTDLPGKTISVDPARNYRRQPRASQTRVFVAHASADKPKLKPILVTLIDQGFQLWVDKPQQIGLGGAYETRLAADRIQYGQDWRESIRVAVVGADAVLAFWSNDAVNGRREQFHYEVYMGMMQKKLSQCRIDSVAFEAIGMPYTFDHIADLSQVSLGAYHPELDYLMQDMTRRRRAWWRLW